MRTHSAVPAPGGGPRLRRRAGPEKSPPFVAAVSVFVFRDARLLAMRRAADSVNPIPVRLMMPTMMPAAAVAISSRTAGLGLLRTRPITSRVHLFTRTRLPSGFSPGQKRRASVSFTMTTSGLPSRSRSVKS